MTKKPFFHAIAAATYITCIIVGIRLSTRVHIQEPNLMIPLAMLSLFVLSAAIMGYLFVAEPLLLYIDGKKREAVQFFLLTVGAFAVLTILAFILLLLGVSL